MRALRFLCHAAVTMMKMTSYQLYDCHCDVSCLWRNYDKIVVRWHRTI